MYRSYTDTKGKVLHFDAHASPRESFLANTRENIQHSLAVFGVGKKLEAYSLSLLSSPKIGF